MELQEDNITLLVKAGVGWKPGVVGHATVKAEKGSSEGHALLTGEPVTSDDIEHEERFTYAEFIKDQGVKALINVIIIGSKGQKPYGILQVDSYKPRHFTESDIQFLKGYANLIAASVDRFRLMEEKEQTESRLRQSQKMEAIGQLTGGIAHDFNNMLAGIIISLELLQKRIMQERYSDIPRYVSGALSSANKAASLTSRLLAFSRQQTLEPKLIRPNRLVVDIEEMLRRTVGPSISIETALSADVGSIMGDPSQLENAILNLAINARDAMPEGGKLWIKTSIFCLEGAQAFEHDLLPGVYVKISVEDNGSGMPPEVIERAFDPFFTTKPQGKGTGLGLSMVYGFTRQSGGNVTINSQLGKGSTVSMYLPRPQEALPTTTHEDKAANVIPRAKKGEMILLIEDDSVVRVMVCELLQDLGYTVMEAADSNECFKYAKQYSKIDLLITDVGLPGGMNGFDLAEAIRNHHSDLKILYITGFTKDVAMRQKLLEPDMHIISKPFAIDTLSIQVRNILDE
jgi:signal transduction histidine kinase